MGAGRGLARRAKSAAATTFSYYDGQTWDDFITIHDLSEINLHEYYGIEKPHHPPKWEEAEQHIVKMATEIINDLVAIDALRLPAGATLDEMKLAVKTGKSAAGERCQQLQITGPRGTITAQNHATDCLYHWDPQLGSGLCTEIVSNL